MATKHSVFKRSGYRLRVKKTRREKESNPFGGRRRAVATTGPQIWLRSASISASRHREGRGTFVPRDSITGGDTMAFVITQRTRAIAMRAATLAFMALPLTATIS